MIVQIYIDTVIDNSSIKFPKFLHLSFRYSCTESSSTSDVSQYGLEHIPSSPEFSLQCTEKCTISLIPFRLKTHIIIFAIITTKYQKRILFTDAAASLIHVGPLIKKRITFQIEPIFGFNVKCFEVGGITTP